MASLANTEEYIDGALSGHLGEVLIRRYEYVKGEENQKIHIGSKYLLPDSPISRSVGGSRIEQTFPYWNRTN
ncbi:hypothetical protein IHE44_0012120 [Lamprotornis superbus]|uniref:Uncharacterized protein n=1 Tax=Lamprotornis superbus TaxID=245042 RepID=A0A835NPB3_9PASS|nr:hypothetical protein IHE44_0012120 [Lamprotornis superbus]